MQSLSPSRVKNWLKDIGGKPAAYPNVAAALAEWIMQGDLSDPQSLTTQLWGQVQHLPSPR
jgi:hypothetical protein